ncbi:MAG: VWA domain-containing protein [Methanotrichaceae archaeon]
MEEISSEKKLVEIWERSRANWHLPQLPLPIIGRPENGESFPFQNYRITVDENIVSQGSLYLENLFDHLIVHYIFCPRSLETAGQLALSAMNGLSTSNLALAKRMVNIFSDIVVDTFRLVRSEEDEEKVISGWRRMADQNLSDLDLAVIGFLGKYWNVDLPASDLPQVEMLLQTFSWGVKDRTKWPRQCQQISRILEPLEPGLLGRGEVRSLEILNGNAHTAPISGLASELEPGQYKNTLSVLGLQGDLKRWYRDQSYNIVIRPSRKTKKSWYPSSLAKWRFTDPPHELDVPYSLSLGLKLVPGVTTYKREQECCKMMAGHDKVPDLLVVLDSSGSMDGHRHGTKTHSATLAAFKASQYAHQQGAELAAINFSDKIVVQEWTRDLSTVEDVMVQYLGSRTHIPGESILKLAQARKNCLILCITDTHIQNLYNEWDNLQKSAEMGQFVLFCIDEANKNKQVEESLRDLGTVYYINKLENLISLVVDTTERTYQAS